MIFINRRAIDILTDIASKKKHYSLSTLSKKENRTERTVRTDLGVINDYLVRSGFPEITVQKDGLFDLEADLFSVQELISHIDFYDYSISREERLRISSLLLICHAGFITLQQVAVFMNVSRSTVANDLEALHESLAVSGLVLSSHPNRGVRVIGDEKKVRLLFFRFMREDPLLVRIFFNQGSVEQFLPALGKSLDDTMLVIRKLITESENLHTVFLSEDSFTQIQYVLLFSVLRTKNGNFLSGPDSLPEQKDRRQIAIHLYKNIIQYFQLSYSPGELRLLNEQMAHLHYIERQADNSNIVEVQTITRKFIEAVSGSLAVNLNTDYSLFEGLSNHLGSAFERDQNLPDFPEGHDILEEYPQVRDVIDEHAHIIQKYINRDLSDTEKEYIAVYLCAAIEKMHNITCINVVLICNSGIGTSQLLKVRIKKLFPFNIVGVITSYELGKVRRGEVDLIISTVPVRNSPVDSVTVTPLLNDEDYMKIGRKVEQIKNRGAPVDRSGRGISFSGPKEIMEKISPYLSSDKELEREVADTVQEYFRKIPSGFHRECMLSDFLTQDFIRLDVDCADWRDAVRQAGGILLGHEYISAGYIESMIQNVERNGPYIVISPGFALPHSGKDDGVKKVGMSLIRLKQPVCFDVGILDPVQLVCCLCAINNTTHLNALFHLVNLLAVSRFKQDLLHAETAEEAAEVIAGYEYNLT
ncbi:BglG family transcription antiterminator [Caproiciproducens sp. CPB-2]|uniref:BglG family transcription antiterminator n=1 Tax=Caproiciproducens sp. CPB-2 TaxID=3030017 RepID=UPI0023DA0757|nr:PTS sugar transporter subunit IIA [Caproiciproducens sp. CPB-2]MDF1495333.1 PTS sugar transporter subunit IIA [Caproiciproducens sp. CPB-2]